MAVVPILRAPGIFGRKTSVPIKLLVLGGGIIIWGFGGGGGRSANLNFMGAMIFPEKSLEYGKEQNRW